ncbi:MAG: hypothetical protein II428_04300, partial [Muribaculaceae bacterium]|nr:hypothetical protein [Muribaculaceae bacterium]
ITLDMVNHKVTFAGEITPIVEDTKVYVLGEVNDNGGWFPYKGAEMATEDNNTFTLAITAAGENEGYSYFSFTKKLASTQPESTDEEAWGAAWEEIAPYRFGAVSEGDFLVTSETLNTPLALTTEGYQAYKIPAGEYTLTVNLTDMTLVISGEVEPVFADVYVLGEVNDNGGWFPYVGAEMATEDGKTYTLDVTTAGENEGYSYFSFTKKLSSTQPESTDEEAWGAAWEEIAPYRFGAEEGEGDCDVVLNQAMPLGADGTTRAYKIGKGEWKFNLDLEGLTLTVTRKALRGDVNNDGTVSSVDLAIIVNILAGLDQAENYDGRADVNGDGQISAVDISQIVNIIAGLEE